MVKRFRLGLRKFVLQSVLICNRYNLVVDHAVRSHLLIENIQSLWEVKQWCCKLVLQFELQYFILANFALLPQIHHEIPILPQINSEIRPLILQKCFGFAVMLYTNSLSIYDILECW